MEKIQLFFDRFGWIFTVLLLIALGVSTYLWMQSDSALSERIEKLEGCCEEVRDYMQSGSGSDVAALQAYIDEQIRLIKEEKAGEEAAKEEARTEELKEEIRILVSETVEAKMKESRAAESTKTGSAAKKKTGSSAQTAGSQSVTSQQSMQQTTITETTGFEAYDPDDAHFKVGTDEED